MPARFTLHTGVAASLALSVILGSVPATASTPARSRPTERVVVVRSGDSIPRLLMGAGASQADVDSAARAIQARLAGRALRPGQEVAIQLDPAHKGALLEVEVEIGPGKTLKARRRGGSWVVDEITAPQQRMLALASGTVDGGLYPAMTTAGLPAGLALSLIRALGHEIDFQRDLQPGDRFAILFERFRDTDGDLLGHGRILHAELVLSGRTLSYWRHPTANGTDDWYDAEGRSLRRGFLRTPLDGARISSGFGQRNHPILGFTRMHQGTDFAAPQGTPVFAAADGVVVSAHSDGGYGLSVRLRHNGGVETRYAHLAGFARGMGAGRRVRQGDVVGTVGSTGLSTGPHLHYEVIVANKPVDPASRVGTTARLGGRELQAFQAHRQMLGRYASRLRPRMEVAMAN